MNINALTRKISEYAPANTLEQQGPWAGHARDLKIDIDWLRDALHKTISAIDWSTAKSDVQRFLPLKRQSELEFWNSDFFLYYCNKLKGAD